MFVNGFRECIGVVLEEIRSRGSALGVLRERHVLPLWVCAARRDVGYGE